MPNAEAPADKERRARQRAYEKNSPKFQEYKKAWGKRKVRANLDFLTQYKTDKPCTDCGGAFPPYVMHFDHVPERGPKKYNLSRASSSSMKSIENEIAKCDLVCANCHAERTYQRRKEKNDS